MGSLLSADSPRSADESDGHIRALAEVDGELPPIVINRVVDGMHRLRAAKLRGDTHIDAVPFEGSHEAFLVPRQAGWLSTIHSAAARRSLRNSGWPCSAFSRTAHTVGSLRQQAGPDAATPTGHAGRDQRGPAAARRRTQELITANPSASLREISRKAGVSVRAVRDVRTRLGAEHDSMPAPRAADQPHGAAVAQRRRGRRQEMTTWEVVASLLEERGQRQS